MEDFAGGYFPRASACFCNKSDKNLYIMIMTTATMRFFGGTSYFGC